MKKQRCPTCHQPIMKHRHVMSFALANILLKAAQKVDPFKPFHLQKDLALTKNEYANFQKLRYWGLAMKAKDRFGARIPGCWYLTDITTKFLTGGSICKWVMTFNNQVIERADEVITINRIDGEFEPPEAWARRAESIRDREPQQLGIF